MIEKWIAFIIVASFMAWLAWKSYQNSDDTPSWFILKCCLSFLLVLAIPISGVYLGIMAVPLTVALCLILTWFWAPTIASFIANPLSSIYGTNDSDHKPTPLYSIAQARVKRGKYAEAVAEIRKQLRAFPNDVEGCFLMADIQANHLKNMDDCVDTIESLLALNGVAVRHAVAALNRLADWKLKLDKDVEGAREALQRICFMYPETEYSLLAEQRIAHLADKHFLEERGNPHLIKMVEGKKGVGLTTQRKPAGSESKEKESSKIGELATEYLAQLKKHPHDYETREKLADLYATANSRIDLALNEIEQLLEQDQASTKKKVMWLNKMTDYHLLADDVVKAKQALQRVVDLYPGTAHADQARSRMGYLKLSARNHEQSKTIKLGQYAPKIGLNPQRPES